VVQGLADTATTTCGETWTTDPGNSSDPPVSVSGTVPVAVSSQITKNYLWSRVTRPGRFLSSWTQAMPATPDTLAPGLSLASSAEANSPRDPSAAAVARTRRR
jgi:hypothetical protein